MEFITLFVLISDNAFKKTKLKIVPAYETLCTYTDIFNYNHITICRTFFSCIPLMNFLPGRTPCVITNIFLSTAHFLRYIHVIHLPC